MITKITNEKWLNLFSKTYKNKKGDEENYLFSSRHQNPPESIANKKPDAVIIAAIIDNPNQPLRHVLTSEYRVAIGGYELGFPAGLIDEDETAEQAAKREFLEETGLILKVSKTSPSRLISSAGCSDECVQIVFGTAQGTISKDNQEASEDIQTHLFTQNQLVTLLSQDSPLNCLGWGAKAWPILMLFANGMTNHYYKK